MASKDLSELARIIVQTYEGPDLAYYDDAEGALENQWERFIGPLIQDFDFTTTLDFAAGHGRHSARLVKFAKQLYLVDASVDAVKFLRQRFSDYDAQHCSIQIIHNNGVDLRDIPTAAITALYSFDSVVHFEKQLVEAYLPEFHRVMAPGAFGLVHHSNFGRVSQDPDFRRNPSWRSNVDKDWFAQCCFRHKLLPVKQTLISWSAGEVLMDELDCLSVVYKPRHGL